MRPVCDREATRGTLPSRTHTLPVGIRAHARTPACLPPCDCVAEPSLDSRPSPSRRSIRALLAHRPTVLVLCGSSRAAGILPCLTGRPCPLQPGDQSLQRAVGSAGPHPRRLRRGGGWCVCPAPLLPVPAGGGGAHNWLHLLSSRRRHASLSCCCRANLDGRSRDCGARRCRGSSGRGGGRLPTAAPSAAPRPR